MDEFKTISVELETKVNKLMNLKSANFLQPGEDKVE